MEPAEEPAEEPIGGGQLWLHQTASMTMLLRRSRVYSRAFEWHAADTSSAASTGLGSEPSECGPPPPPPPGWWERGTEGRRAAEERRLDERLVLCRYGARTGG